jgi:hypothetical protein
MPGLTADWQPPVLSAVAGFCFAWSTTMAEERQHRRSHRDYAIHFEQFPIRVGLYR